MSATLLWFSGGETGSINEFTGPNVTITGPGPTVQTGTKRSGAYALKTPGHTAGAGGGDTAKQRVILGGASTTFFRGYFKMASNPAVDQSILGVGSNNSIPKFHVFVTTTGAVGWAYATGPASPTATGGNTIDLSGWNLLEVKYVRDASVGGMEIYLNGVLQTSSFVTATTSGTSTSSMAWMFGDATFQGGNVDIYWDDLAVGTGSYIGAGQSIAVQGQAGAVTYDTWTKSSGSTAYNLWSETPFSATNFCSAATIGNKQTMVLAASGLSAGVTINGASVVCVAKIVSFGTMKMLHRLSGVDSLGTAMAMSTTDTFEPNGQNSDSMNIFTPTVGQLSGLEIGVECESTNTTTVEDVWLLVDYVPAAPTTLSLLLPEPLESAATLSLSIPLPLESLGEVLLSLLLPVLLESGSLLSLSLPLLVESFIQFGADGIAPGLPLPLETDGTPADALNIVFSVGETDTAPLNIQFDINGVPIVLDPLNIRFDIIDQNPDALEVTFDVIPSALTRLRLTNDVQAPFARVTIT